MAHLRHHNSGYVALDGDQGILTDDLIAQPASNIDMATSETHVNEYWPYGDEEKYTLAQRTLHTLFINLL